MLRVRYQRGGASHSKGRWEPLARKLRLWQPVSSLSPPSNCATGAPHSWTARAARPRGAPRSSSCKNGRRSDSERCVGLKQGGRRHGRRGGQRKSFDFGANSSSNGWPKRDLSWPTVTSYRTKG
eukprot:scaffold923_cov256-Pinguiococcus_pyrenoidosus.AAC.46